MLAREHRRDLNGHLLGQGSPFTIDDMEIADLCAFVWWFFTKDAESAERRKFEARLWRPDPQSEKPIPKESPWSAENEMKGFAALKMETGA